MNGGQIVAVRDSVGIRKLAEEARVERQRRDAYTYRHREEECSEPALLRAALQRNASHPKSPKQRGGR